MSITRHVGTRRLVIAAAIAILLLAIFARLMNYDMRRDEQLYVPPALLLDRLSLYRDFFYNHVPLSAWLFHFVHMVTASDHLLLIGRLCVFAGWVLFGGGVAWVTWRLTRSGAMTLFAVLLILTNDALLTVTGMTATNNFLPLPMAYLGLGLFLLGTGAEDGRIRPAMVAGAGLMLALAASTKISAFIFIPPVAVAALLMPRAAGFGERLRKVVLPLLAGGIAGALPVLYYLAIDPARFFAHVLGFHTGPHVAYWAAHTSAEDDVALGIGAKLKLALDVWFAGTNILFLFALALLIVQVSAGGDARRKFLTGPLLLVAATFGLVAAASFAPTPSFPQYFAPPLVCAPLVLALLHARLDVKGRAVVRPALIAASIIVALINVPRLAQHGASLPFPKKWTVLRVHRGGEQIAERMKAAGVQGKVATLAPVYPLEAGLPVYAELSTGQFAYRLADITKPDLLKYWVTTSPTRIEGLFQADPPAAILTGIDPALEAPMLRFAQANGYRSAPDFKLKDRYGDLTLWLRGR